MAARSQYRAPLFSIASAAGAQPEEADSSHQHHDAYKSPPAEADAAGELQTLHRKRRHRKSQTDEVAEAPQEPRTAICLDSRPVLTAQSLQRYYGLVNWYSPSVGQAEHEQHVEEVSRASGLKHGLRRWCAVCKQPVADLEGEPSDVRACSGCHRCYHVACAESAGIKTSQGLQLPSWLRPAWIQPQWFHSFFCGKVRRKLDGFARRGEVELEAYSDDEDADNEDAPEAYYTMRLFNNSDRSEQLVKETAYRQFLATLQRYSPYDSQALTASDCLGFDYGLLLWRNGRPSAAALVDVFGHELADLVLVAAERADAHGYLVQNLGSLLQHMGVQRIAVEAAVDDLELQALWEQEYGFRDMERRTLRRLGREVPEFAPELQRGTKYLVRDLYPTADVMKGPEDLAEQFEIVDVSEDQLPQEPGPSKSPSSRAAGGAQPEQKQESGRWWR